MHKFYENVKEEHFNDVLTELGPFEKELVSRGKPFFGGSEI
jgi:hypothetical protein